MRKKGSHVGGSLASQALLATGMLTILLLIFIGSHIRIVAAPNMQGRLPPREEVKTNEMAERLSALSPSPPSSPFSTPPTCLPTWTRVPSADPTSNANHLFSVAVLASNDVWAVGDYGDDVNIGRTLVLHWDGASWNVIPSPNVASADANLLSGLALLSHDDMWAVGHFIDGSGDHTLTMHWDGVSWAIVPSPDVGTGTNWLNSVAAISTNNVWAAGFYSTTNPFATLIEHWDGSQWTIINSPNIGTGSNELWGLSATSATDIWAVGYSQPPASEYQPLTLHWEGNQWSVVPSPRSPTQDTYLRGVNGLSPTDVWAVGNIGLSTFTIRWDGNQWNVVPSPNVGADLNQFDAVTCLSSNDIWAVGYHCCNSGPGPLAEHWDGNQWSIVFTPGPSSQGNYFKAIAGVSSDDVWAVGHFLDNTGTAKTLTEHYARSCASPSPSPTPSRYPTFPSSSPTSSPTMAPSATHCAISFTDVPEGSTFYPFIRCLACRGILNGYSSGCETGNPCFRPQNNVTRGQIAKIVSNSAGFHEISGPQQFEDVPPGSTFYDYIWRLAARGYINGYPCGAPPAGPCNPPASYPYFLPNDDVTRGQITKIVSNAAGFSDPPSGQQFEDIPPDSTFYTYTYRLVTRSIMSGYPCGAPPAGPCIPPNNYPYFLPGNSATRGQSAKIIANSFLPDCSTPATRKELH